MIAKRVARRRDGKSSFGALVKYLEDDQGKDSRVGDVTVTNCQSDDTRWGVLEIEATQDLNRRAKSDKTYHLVFSFREGEDVTPEVLRQIESELCKGLGYEEHQRISVVHRDTDNLHVHVAINKIHPKTHNLIEPYYDHKRLGELCARLEVEHGLERDNHVAAKSASKADDLAAKSGMETLAAWLKENALPGCDKAGTWAELHQHFAQYGVEIKKRGAGLVIVNEDGIAVKASTVSRSLSLKALEARLGVVEESPASIAKTKAKAKYQPRPKVRSDALFARYQTEQTTNTLKQRADLAELQKQKAAALAAAKLAAKTKRAATKALKGAGAGILSRRLLYSQIAKSHRASITKIHEDFAERKKKLYSKSPRKAFRDWISDQAVGGDQEALGYLRATGARMKGNLVGGGDGQLSTAPVLPVESVTRSGAVTYATPAGAIRDDGNRFKLAAEPTDAAIAAALQLAMKRHGERLSVSGTDSFKAKVAAVAGRLSLSVSFEDEALEKVRKASISGALSHRQAAEKYISERNDKRSRGFDIMKHRHFEKADEGVRAFAGLRKIDGISVALFGNGEEVLALPVSASTAARLQRQRIGQEVQVSADGSCQVKGTTRSR